MATENRGPVVVILLADDDDTYTGTLSDTVSHEVAPALKAIFRVVVAHTIEDMQRKLQEIDPDTIVLDIDFTESGGGFDDGMRRGLPALLVSRALCGRPRLGVPVFLISAVPEFVRDQSVSEIAERLGAVFHKKDCHVGTFARLVAETALKFAEERHP